MITINGVRQAIHQHVQEEFPNTEVIEEVMEQDPSRSCFFIVLSSVEQSRALDKRYKRSHHFDIGYFPESDVEAHVEMHHIAEQLYDSMEYVELEDGFIRGDQMQHEIVDGILHFYVQYDIRLSRLKTVGTPMRMMSQEGFVDES